MLTWNEIQARRLPFYKRFTKKGYVALTRQLAPLFEALKRVTDLDSFIDSIDHLITTEAIYSYYIDMFTHVGAAFSKFTKRDFKSSIIGIRKKDLENDIWMESMEDYVRTDIAERIVLVTDQTKKVTKTLVKRYVDQGLTNGMGIGEITKLIKKNLTKEGVNIKTWRAKRIATTEVGAAANYGIHKTAESTGLLLAKVWLLAPPGLAKVKERHSLLTDLAKQRPRMDQDFIVDGTPMMYPQDPKGGAQNVINCRCGYAHEVIGG